MTAGQQRGARPQIGFANAILEQSRWPLAAVAVIRVMIRSATSVGKSWQSSTIGLSSDLVQNSQ